MVDSPAPLSFPAILRNPGLSSRFAHLQPKPQVLSATGPSKRLKRELNEGKRWIRRKDNARFTGNPHIITATKQDYVLQTPHTVPTFPEPLPPYLPRSATLPTTIVPVRDPITANAGRFSLSLKGMRRELRKSGFRAEALVRDIDHQVTEWLQAGGTMLAPDVNHTIAGDIPTTGTPIGETGTIIEVSRTPLQLVWSIADDSFARYIVHCCARYYEVVSFSKEVSGRRLTYLLRPNVLRPDHYAPITLDTPPVTDLDYSSHPDSDLDHLSELDSDVEQRPPSSRHPLTSVSEDMPAHISDGEGWSVIEGSDIDGDESGDDASLVASVESLSLAPDCVLDPVLLSNSDRTPRPDPSMRSGVWERNKQHLGRSASSPSRSPARRVLRRGLRPLHFNPLHKKGFILPLHHHQSFYNYLFL